MKVLPPPAITTENFFMILPPSWWYVRSKENLSSGFPAGRALGNVQADDDLNPVAAAYYPWAPSALKTSSLCVFAISTSAMRSRVAQLLMLSMLSAPPRACRKPAA
nr:Uncharacterised protein [Klebsiella pneumoniae]